jgi:sulfate transport system ATP-binding protein
MSVFENVAFGLRVRPKAARPPEKEIQDRCMALLKLVQLDWLARAIPTSSPAASASGSHWPGPWPWNPRCYCSTSRSVPSTRRSEGMRRWLRRLHDEIHVTSVFVTHDQEEALEVADQVVVMNEGRVEQVGTPTEVYDHPATPFVYSFLGNVNLFKGRLHAGGIHIGGQLMSPTEATEGEGSAVAYVRTHEIQLDVDSATGEGVIQATVSHIRAFGSLVRVDLEPVGGGEMIEAEVPRERFDALGLAKGAVVYVKPKRIKVFLEQ